MQTFFLFPRSDELLAGTWPVLHHSMCNFGKLEKAWIWEGAVGPGLPEASMTLLTNLAKELALAASWQFSGVLPRRFCISLGCCASAMIIPPLMGAMKQTGPHGGVIWAPKIDKNTSTCCEQRWRAMSHDKESWMMATGNSLLDAFHHAVRSKAAIPNRRVQEILSWADLTPWRRNSQLRQPELQSEGNAKFPRCNCTKQKK